MGEGPGFPAPGPREIVILGGLIVGIVLVVRFLLALMGNEPPRGHVKK